MNHCLSPLEDVDLLQEILLRLPPKPASFPRASLVCKCWRSILSDPRFLRRFRKHHRKPSLLGFFDKGWHQAPVFTPMLHPPDGIPFASFTVPENLLGLEPWTTSFFGCHHGLALFLDRKLCEAFLWDPLNSVQRRVAFPQRFGDGKDDFIRSAAVLCPDDDGQHVHGDCNMSPFKLIFACHDLKCTKVSVCIYESKSGVWGDIISTATTDTISRYRPGVFVGNALCWLLLGGDICEFDFERMTLAVIKKPTDVCGINFDVERSFQILRQDNGLGLAILSGSTLQLWARKSSCDGRVSWVLQDTVQVAKLFSRHLSPGVGKHAQMPGYDEDTNVIFLSSASHDFVLQLDSMQYRYIGRNEYKSFKMYYPYTNFYTAGNTSAVALHTQQIELLLLRFIPSTSGACLF